MKYILALVMVLAFATQAYCGIKYIDGYSRRDGTYVSGHYRDTSNDGYSYNNANTFGYQRRTPKGIYD